MLNNILLNGIGSAFDFILPYPMGQMAPNADLGESSSRGEGSVTVEHSRWGTERLLTESHWIQLISHINKCLCNFSPTLHLSLYWDCLAKGKMSEKLSRCRKELTAAIDRAVEDLTVLNRSPDSTTNQDFDGQITHPLMPPCEDLSSRKDEAECGPHQSLPVSSVPEKENPFFRPNLSPGSADSSTLCIKREPLTSKENTCLHSSVFMADRQFFISLEDSEKWKKGHLSKTDERPMKSEACISSSDGHQETPKDLGNMNDNLIIWPSERLQRKSDFENELQQICRISSELGSPEEVSALSLDLRSNFRGVLERSLEDDAIIETLLDMEEDYRQTDCSTLH